MIDRWQQHHVTVFDLRCWALLWFWGRFLHGFQPFVPSPQLQQDFVLSPEYFSTGSDLNRRFQVATAATADDLTAQVPLALLPTFVIYRWAGGPWWETEFHRPQRPTEIKE